MPTIHLPDFYCPNRDEVAKPQLPLGATPLRQRSARRRELRNTIRWVAALVQPYVVYLAVDPVGRLPRITVRALNFVRALATG